eukprot:CAMPEP_0202366010 /NCGR_PEP_ID=MMETSP1126-20121109/16800_1 /ASSEMBLY_ACC=CAM_ASM_000457 /TAXON_ID=3047 /ORGANISM="Dunaliella tertiolecta, Strain CCMP1320" /LENGTH=82 /DNA_ID=CAMNT_0048960989 /DNA_START=1853 /DNA_END=2101 /DNA_ORIENTATION=+
MLLPMSARKAMPPETVPKRRRSKDTWVTTFAFGPPAKSARPSYVYLPVIAAAWISHVHVRSLARPTRAAVKHPPNTPSFEKA